VTSNIKNPAYRASTVSDSANEAALHNLFSHINKLHVGSWMQHFSHVIASDPHHLDKVVTPALQGLLSATTHEKLTVQRNPWSSLRPNQGKWRPALTVDIFRHMVQYFFIVRSVLISRDIRTKVNVASMLSLVSYDSQSCHRFLPSHSENLSSFDHALIDGEQSLARRVAKKWEEGRQGRRR
jgi:hypothetical protein